ncbi:MAG TPA: PQQ-dependent sugar dehydrogenase, partial [Planctomycetota bacterium]|nr:PQQ-dependent sugar dehydrogenase [Planctomycetota bacterium]
SRTPLDVRDPSVPEQILLTAPTGAIYHNGGHISIGPDGKLYLGVGDSHSSGAQSQDMTVVGGKINRINTDGSIPSDNPTTFQGLGGSLGAPSSVWCCGLRNPFSHAWQQGTGRFFINDVGQDTWEEINDGIKGRNYGWQGGATDGFRNLPNFTDPLYAYKHGGDAGNGNPLSGNVITGGAFYSGVSAGAQYKFPSAYTDHYFFADNGAGWISHMDVSTLSIPNNAAGGNFASGINGPVDLRVNTDGALYYLAINSGELRMITFGPVNTAPTISQQPANQTVTEGQTATFSVTAGGTAPLSFQWQSMPPGGAFADISGATSSSYTTGATTVGMTGTQYRVRVSNSINNVTSNPATLTVNYAPPVITQQPQNRTVTVGSTASFSVTATGTSLTYQWQSMPPGGAFANLGGATSASYTTPATTLAMSGTQYRVIIDNPAAGTVTSNAATLTVTSGTIPPAISGQPASETVTAPATATFSVTATGTNLTYQWQSMAPGGAFANLGGATGASYTTPATTVGMSGTQYRVVVSGDGPSVTSAAATLTVNGPAAATPLISPNGGTFSGPVTVRLSTTTAGATIHYTLNNTAPTSGSAAYTTPVVVSATTTVRAVAIPSGNANSTSAEADAVFTITGTTPYGLPFRDPPSGLNIPSSEAGLPPTLTATMLFQSPVSTLTPSPGLIPFTVNDPLWSDGAVKKRWIALPGNAQITFAATGEWSFPAGTILVKHFDLPINDTNPSQTKRLETRVFYIDPAGGSYGATYKWRADNSDADLLPGTAALDEVETITTATGTRTQTWSYPSRSDCLNCHNAAAKVVLGPKTRQLNGSFAYPGGTTDNQLRTWSYLQMFTVPLTEGAIPTYSALVAVGDVNSTLENRVRSYLDSNCGHCHRPGGPSAPAGWDGRYDTALSATNIVNGPVNGSTQGLTNPKIVVPMDPTNSMMLYRMLSLTQGVRMPQIASHVVDVDATTTITAWINTLTPTGGGGGGTGGGGTGGGGVGGGSPAAISKPASVWGSCGATGLEVGVLGLILLLRRRVRR